MVSIHFTNEIKKVPSGNPTIKNRRAGTFAKDACKQYVTVEKALNYLALLFFKLVFSNKAKSARHSGTSMK